MEKKQLKGKAYKKFEKMIKDVVDEYYEALLQERRAKKNIKKR